MVARGEPQVAELDEPLAHDSRVPRCPMREPKEREVQPVNLFVTFVA